jgi:vancomycin resistance protein YoaR
MTVPYVPAGQDATVYFGAKDFIFKNNTNGNVLIWAQMVDNTLYMALYGTKQPPTVIWHHEILRRNPSWNIYKTNNKLKVGTQNTITEGHEGIVVRSSISTIYENGIKKTTNFGTKYYAPCPSLIERN